MDPQRRRVMRTGRTCTSCGEFSISPSSTVATSQLPPVLGNSPSLLQAQWPLVSFLLFLIRFWYLIITFEALRVFLILPNSKRVTIFFLENNLASLSGVHYFYFIKIIWGRDGQTIAQRPKPAIFVNSFIGTQPSSFFIHFPIVAFLLQWQSWIIATETTWQTKLKIFNSSL